MKVEIMGTERALLGFLLAKMHKMDPDVIVVRPGLSFLPPLFKHILFKRKGLGVAIQRDVTLSIHIHSHIISLLHSLRERAWETWQ
jgi:hypothetical protein